MKIKLIIAGTDESYTSRLISNLTGRYAEQLEIYSFTDKELLMAFAKEEKADVILAEKEFSDVVMECKNERTAFAYFIDYKAEEADGMLAVCKYQKVEHIYKQILSLYSELGKNYGIFADKISGMKVVSFWGISGGAGASTMAAAFALHQAKKGKKALYLNLEKMASTEAFFSGNGASAFDDILFALKSKKMNLAMKIESVVRKDVKGVYFFEPCRNCVDILEIGREDIETLVKEIDSLSNYDYLVIDSDFTLDEKMNIIGKLSDQIVMVSTGNHINNLKMQQYLQSIEALEERSKDRLLPKMMVVYNMFRNRESKAIDMDKMKSIGGVPMFEHGTPVSVMKQIAEMDFWGSQE